MCSASSRVLSRGPRNSHATHGDRLGQYVSGTCVGEAALVSTPPLRPTHPWTKLLTESPAKLAAPGEHFSIQ